jgi:hypothetical protein
MQLSRAPTGASEANVTNVTENPCSTEEKEPKTALAHISGW